MTTIATLTCRKCLLFKVVVGQVLLLVSLAGVAAPLSLVTVEYPPFSYIEDGKQVGIAIDLIREASARLQQQITIEFIPFVRATHMIQNGQADGIFPFAKNDSRLAFALYPTQPLVEQQPALFVRKDFNILFDGDLSKLGQLTFGVERGANYGPEFALAIKNGVLTKLDGSEDQQHNLIKLVRGRFDIAVGPRMVVLFYAKQAGLLGEIKELHPNLGKPVNAYLAFSKMKVSQTVVDQYDVIFKKMRKDGTYDKIVRAYSE